MAVACGRRVSSFGGLGYDGYTWGRVVQIGIPSAALVLLTGVGSLVLGPALLPWLPGRPFSLKGFWVGLALVLLLFGCGLFADALTPNWASMSAWCLILPSVASVLVMKFTGASTYTSLSRRPSRNACGLADPASLLRLGTGPVVGGKTYVNARESREQPCLACDTFGM